MRGGGVPRGAPRGRARLVHGDAACQFSGKIVKSSTAARWRAIREAPRACVATRRDRREPVCVHVK